MKRVSHQQASQLLRNKFVVVLGDSIQRSVYKDLVLLLQKEKYLNLKQLKSKGEMSFEQDCLVEGGCLGEMHNGIEYREVRQFQSDHHLVRFYFVTRVYSPYMQSILEDFRKGLKPDVIIINSCIWDISRYRSYWLDTYKEDLHNFFNELRGIVPDETLVIWNLTMPLGERITGGFLVPEMKHKASQLRYDVVDANFYSGTLADAYGMDVLDLHFQFRFSLQHRTRDGIHWNAVAHRWITSLLLQHSAQAWGVIMPCALTAVGEEEYCLHTQIKHPEDFAEQPAKENASRPASKMSGRHQALRACNNLYLPPPNISNIEQYPSNGYYSDYGEFFSNAPSYGYMPFENIEPYGIPPPHLRHGYGADVGFNYRPLDRKRHRQNVMRSPHTRHHYAPYTYRHRLHKYGSYY